MRAAPAPGRTSGRSFGKRECQKCPSPRPRPDLPCWRGRRGLVMGLANNAVHRLGHRQGGARAAGAELAFTFQGEALEKRVRPLAKELDGPRRGSLRRHGCRLDRCRFRGGETGLGAGSISWSTASPFRTRMSSPAATSIRRKTIFRSRSPSPATRSPRWAQRAEKLMTAGGAMLTLTYYGAEKWMPHYNVMGGRQGGARSQRPLSRGRPRRKGYPGQCRLGWPDQDAGGLRHRRFPLHPEMERTERALAADRDDRRGGGECGLHAVAHGAWHHGRNHPRRCRLPHRRHEKPCRTRYRGRGQRRGAAGLTSKAVFPDFFFIRHGETDWNREGRLQGRRDVDLNPLGRRQSVAAGRAAGPGCWPGEASIRKHSTSSLRRSLGPATRWCCCAGRSGSTASRSAATTRSSNCRSADGKAGPGPRSSAAIPRPREERRRDRWCFVPPRRRKLCDARGQGGILARRSRRRYRRGGRMEGVARVLLHLVAGVAQGAGARGGDLTRAGCSCSGPEPRIGPDPKAAPPAMPRRQRPRSPRRALWQTEAATGAGVPPGSETA